MRVSCNNTLRELWTLLTQVRIQRAQCSGIFRVRAKEFRFGGGAEIRGALIIRRCNLSIGEEKGLSVALAIAGVRLTTEGCKNVYLIVVIMLADPVQIG